MISAKFKVQRITPQSDIVGKDNQIKKSAEVELVPDYAGDRNKDWSEYTPSGVIRMNVNGPALEQLTVGKEFTIVFYAEGEDSGMIFAKPSLAEEYHS